MDKQWNYYRILQVQPDAPFEVIRHNYLVLLKKLRLHPDLGGNEKDTRLLNIAYETLSNPVKRARHDRELMLHSNIKKLSLGPLEGQSVFPMLPKRPVLPAGMNRRNFYRLLGVHPEADPVVIRERCTAMRAESHFPRELLDTAYSILSHPAKRREYDRLLKRYDHATAIQQMRPAKPQTEGKAPPDLYRGPGNAYIHGFNPADPLLPDTARPVPHNAYPAALLKGKPVSCFFCNEPQPSREPEKPAGRMCENCKSPLFFTEDVRAPGGGRICDRVRKAESIRFYVYWPGDSFPGRLFDISPTGMRLESEYGLHPGQIIKIDGVSFKAVGEVVHSQTKKNEITSSGIRFLSVDFFAIRGNFLDARG
ncbi:MAG: DnaJ domain-containing protein [Desulfobacteraceae bacterium]|nr:DnaJ domain-containing protein [Desulfobacteraceae bacterium]